MIFLYANLEIFQYFSILNKLEKLEEFLLFFSNQFTDKSVEEELILYKKHILPVKL